jgi:YVTN family beta-propeller protein
MKNAKTVFLTGLLLSSAISASSIASEVSSASPPALYLDGVPLGGTALLSAAGKAAGVRVVSEALGASVAWDASTRSARVYFQGKTLSFAADAAGTSLVKNRLLVPVAPLASFLGLDYELISSRGELAFSSGVPKVYVANEYADSISVINAKTNRKLKDIALEPFLEELSEGEHGGDEMESHSGGDGEDHGEAKVIPHNIQVAPDGRTVYIAAAGRDAIWVIDARTDTLTKEIKVGAHPAHVVITNDSRTAYVTNGGAGSVSVVDLVAGKTVKTIKVGLQPHGLRVSPNGKDVFVANTGSDSISIIDTGKQTAVATVKVLGKPAQVGFTPDGRKVYVSNAHLGEDKAGHVSIIDVATRKVALNVEVGRTPIQVHATPDGRQVFVANTGTGDVSVIDTASNRVIATIKAGKEAHGVTVAADGKSVYVSNTGDGTVTVIDTARLAAVATITAGPGSNGISYRAGR